MTKRIEGHDRLHLIRDTMKCSLVFEKLTDALEEVWTMALKNTLKGKRDKSFVQKFYRAEEPVFRL